MKILYLLNNHWIEDEKIQWKVTPFSLFLTSVIGILSGIFLAEISPYVYMGLAYLYKQNLLLKFIIAIFSACCLLVMLSCSVITFNLIEVIAPTRKKLVERLIFIPTAFAIGSLIFMISVILKYSH